MIQRAFITQWGTVVPWSSPRLVEQDLIICRALVSIYTDEFLASHLAFRGGTALHKHLRNIRCTASVPTRNHHLSRKLMITGRLLNSRTSFRNSSDIKKDGQ